MAEMPVLRANGNFGRLNVADQGNGSVALTSTTTAGNTSLTFNAPNGEWVKLDMYDDGSGTMSFVVVLV